MGIYQVLYVKPTLVILTQPQHGIHLVKTIATKEFLKNLVGTENLTSLTEKLTTICKTKLVCSQLYKLYLD